MCGDLSRLLHVLTFAQTCVHADPPTTRTRITPVTCTNTRTHTYTHTHTHTQQGVLHLKTDCSLLDAETILCTPRLNESGCFKGYKVIFTCPGEEACANAIRFNDTVFFPAGYPRTRDVLLKAGYKVEEMQCSEFAKLDGGMSCLSLRFSPH